MLLERFEYFPRLAAKVVRQKTWDIRGSSEAPQIGDAGAYRGRFEAVRVSYDPTGHEAAVTPAHHGRANGIRDAQRNHAVDSGHIVFIILSTPIAHIRKPELPAIAARSPRIRTQDGIAAGGERRYRINSEAADKILSEDAGRSAVDVENERIPFARLIADRQSEQSFDADAVFRLPGNGFRLA